MASLVVAQLYRPCARRSAFGALREAMALQSPLMDGAPDLNLLHCPIPLVELACSLAPLAGVVDQLALEVDGDHGDRRAVDLDGGPEGTAAHLAGHSLIHGRGGVVEHLVLGLDRPHPWGEGADLGDVRQRVGRQDGHPDLAVVGVAGGGVGQLVGESGLEAG